MADSAKALFTRQKKAFFGVSLGFMLPQNPKKKNLFVKKKFENAYFAKNTMRKKIITCYAWRIKPVNPVCKTEEKQDFGLSVR